jgi:glycosyltransferase involved in cell wall biosynthesis
MIRIAQVGPVATSIPPPRSSSVELMTSLLTEGLVAAGHQVTLFATGTSRTSGSLHATFPRGYADDPSLWPWEACELFNIAAAVECASRFDLIHCQAMYWPMALPFSRLCPTPLVQTLHHAPTAPEVALWSRYPDVPFIAISREQARLLTGVNVVGVVQHAIDTDAFRFRADPEDYLVFLGRFTEGKGVLQAIEVATAAGMRLLLAAAENDYFRDRVAPLVDGSRIVYLGEVDHAAKVTLLGGARALLYPVQSGEPFGLVLAEAMACGTPVAALDRGAVREVVEDGITGRVFGSIAEMIQELPAVLALDRAHVRRRAEERFGIARMVQEYVALYEHVIASARAPR